MLMWEWMYKRKTFSSVELGDWTLGEQSIVYVRLLLWGIWTRSGSSKCRRPRTGLSIGLVHPDPCNLWTRSPLFQELSIHAQPSTLGTVIYNFLPSNERRKPCSPFLSQVYLHFPMFILLLFSSSPLFFVCVPHNKYPFLTSLFSPFVLSFLFL